MQTDWNSHWTNFKHVRITFFCWSNREIIGMAKTSSTNSGVGGPTTWKDMLRNVLSDVVNWQARKLSNFTKFLILVWTIISTKRRNWNQLENCQKYAHKLSWTACTWPNWTTWHLVVREHIGKISHEMDSGMWQTTSKVDLMYFFITQMTIVNIVMWETRHSTADLGYFKTQTLQATLRIQSQPQVVVSCEFLEVKTFVPVSWMYKHQTAVLHSSTQSEIISLDAGLRMEWVTLLLTHGTLWSRCYVQPRTTFNLVTQAPGKLEADPTQPYKLKETCSMFNPTGQFVIPKPWTNIRLENKGLINWAKWIVYSPTHVLFKGNLSCTSLTTTKPWSRLKTRGRSPTRWDMCREITESLLIGCLLIESTWKSKIQIKFVDTKN